MPPKDYKAYAATEKGKASRAQARAKYLAKRKTAQQIIAMVSTKVILSPEQVAMIEAAENTIEG